MIDFANRIGQAAVRHYACGLGATYQDSSRPHADAMTPEDFRELVAANDDAALLGPCLREDLVPYVFDPDPPTWNAFRDDLVVALGVVRADITVVGSGRFGFSTKPDADLRPFSDRSDIDVIVVNPALFDDLWLRLLRGAYPRPPVTNQVGGWLRVRQSELYTGWLSPLEIRLDRKIFGAKAQPVLDFNIQWFNTFKHAARRLPRRHEDVKGRLYRTWQHAELYHSHSLAALRRSLAP